MYDRQRIPFEERVERYKKWSVEELAKELAMRDIQEEISRPIQDSDFYGLPNAICAKPPKCKSWDDCDNPFRDCINCPLRFITGGGITSPSYFQAVAPKITDPVYESKSTDLTGNVVMESKSNEITGVDFK